jgi:hypothetical protein
MGVSGISNFNTGRRGDLEYQAPVCIHQLQTDELSAQAHHFYTLGEL